MSDRGTEYVVARIAGLYLELVLRRSALNVGSWEGLLAVGEHAVRVWTGQTGSQGRSHLEDLADALGAQRLEGWGQRGARDYQIHEQAPPDRPAGMSCAGCGQAFPPSANFAIEYAVSVEQGYIFRREHRCTGTPHDFWAAYQDKECIAWSATGGALREWLSDRAGVKPDHSGNDRRSRSADIPIAKDAPETVPEIGREWSRARRNR